MNKLHNSWSDAKLAVFTAGDDSQGMNAAIRAVVRMAHYLGCTVMYIKQGFKGMVAGGDNFTEASWISTEDIAGVGGTILKTCKCPEFVERATRMKAAKNLIENGIQNIVAIGGDGTLKGVHSLQKEWQSIIRSLDDKNLVDKSLLHKYKSLRVVGIVSSIVNDVCGTDMAIGANSAIHKILEATDAIATSASSTRAAFVIEVMGKTSGYLALAAAVACDASMVFLPEWPPQGDWREELYSKVRDDHLMGVECIIIFVSEGATDRFGKPITSSDVCCVLTEKLNINCQATVLGHVQCGGVPSAYDRVIAARMGAEAVVALKGLTDEHGSCVIGINGNEISHMSMEKCLETNDLLEHHLVDKNFMEAVRLRGRHFQSLLSSYVLLHSMRSNPGIIDLPLSRDRTVAVIQVGKACVGQCLIIKSFVGFCQSRGFSVLAIKDGFEGLLKGTVVRLCWDVVKHWSSRVNDCLGSCRYPAAHYGLENIDAAIQNLGLCGLLLVGSFPAFESLYQMYEKVGTYRNFGIPMCMVPVTIMNNIPGCEISIGSDSALNEIVGYCDKMKRLAKANKNYVYIIETLGQNCGYLTTMCAVCVGADAAYIRQEVVNLDTLLQDVDHIKNKIQKSGVRNALILRSEFANENYTSDFMHKLFTEEGAGVFSCRTGSVGQVQLGVLPSPMDRKSGTIYGLRSGEWLLNTVEAISPMNGMIYDESPKNKVVLCLNKRIIMFRPVTRLLAETDLQLKVPTYNWWLKLRPLIRILTQHYEEDYEMESTDDNEDTPQEETTQLFDHAVGV
ncbi:ATP-dependent 6-phosphofructokinase-like [Physella acuta]|uniref:ATP-dependent 6-phosphofructokinase-like n=1 Tax=Physella acuta TaxID=109671 RepID=UPI0027DCD9DE|nr:ATP-dependent 6-phosphofructokinase-like [Physella acuta]